jgi:hypothetical protein
MSLLNKEGGYQVRAFESGTPPPSLRVGQLVAIRSFLMDSPEMIRLRLFQGRQEALEKMFCEAELTRKLFGLLSLELAYQQFH